MVAPYPGIYQINMMVAVQARELGLNAFGEVHLTCAEGKVGLMGFESIFYLSSMSLVSPSFELL